MGLKDTFCLSFEMRQSPRAEAAAVKYLKLQEFHPQEQISSMGKVIPSSSMSVDISAYLFCKASHKSCTISHLAFITSQIGSTVLQSVVQLAVLRTDNRHVQRLKKGKSA